MADEFGEIGEDVADEVAVEATSPKMRMLGAGLVPIGEDLRGGAIDRSASKKGEVDESSLNASIKRMMRSTSSKIFGRGDSAGQPDKPAQASSSSRMKGFGSRKKLIEATDAEVMPDGSVSFKQRRQSDAVLDSATARPPKQGDSLSSSGTNASTSIRGSGSMRNLFAANGRRASDSGVPLGRGGSSKKLPGLAGAAGNEETLPPKPKPGPPRTAYAKIAQQRAATFSAPALLATPYGRKWNIDLFAMSQNALRDELADTYYLLSALDRMFVDVEMEDIELFFDHWEVTSSFIVTYFFIEEPVWYARLAKRVTINGPLSRKERTKSKSEIGRMLQTLRVTFDSELVYLPPSEALRLLREKINKAVSALLSYLTLELKLLPDLIEKYVPVSEKDAMEEEIFAAWFNGTDECYAVMAVKWLKDPGQRKFFEKKHIDKKKRKKEYLVKVQHFEEHHAALVREVNERSKRVVVDMLQGENETGELVPEFYKAEVDDHFEKEWEWVDGTEVDQELVQQSGVVEAAEDPATAVAH